MSIHQTLDEFCDYATFVKGLSNNTIKRYKDKIRFFYKYSNIKHFDDINEQLVYHFFYKGRTERKWQARTYITYYMSLRSFFKWLLKQGHIQQNYILDIECPKIPKSLPKGLTKQESLLLLEVVVNYPYEMKFQRFRNHAIFATFIFAGLRKDELFKLKLSDVDVENKTIFINGKGDKERIIPMSSELARILSKYLRERLKQKKTCPYFFLSTKLDKGFTDSGLRLLVIQIRKASGIYFRPHMLRHTFATLMLEGGCDIFSLSKMMGHSDIKVTTGYMFASVQHLRGQMSKHPLEVKKPKTINEYYENTRSDVGYTNVFPPINPGSQQSF